MQNNSAFEICFQNFVIQNNFNSKFPKKICYLRKMIFSFNIFWNMKDKSAIKASQSLMYF